MKIFGFIGSPLKDKSNTYTLTRMLVDKLANIDNRIECDIITASDVHITPCTGCWSCMAKGFCPLDARDDMAILKDKMVKSNLIIWGSPVYAMQVSGQMKTFLDRLAHWYHTLRLVGKPGVTVSTTAGAGLEEVHQYLKVLLNAAGVKVVSTLDTYGTLPGTLLNPENASKLAEEVAYKIYPFITGSTPIETDEGLEKSFQTNKTKVMYGAEVLGADLIYWQDHGMMEMNSFEELLHKR